MGFTLIEVIAAMVIFAMGVLMVIQLNSSLADRMYYAARTSTVVALTHERLDSIESLPFDSVATGTTLDTVTVDGVVYRRQAVIKSITALLLSVDVTMVPIVSAAGPSYSAGSFIAQPW